MKELSKTTGQQNDWHLYLIGEEEKLILTQQEVQALLDSPDNLVAISRHGLIINRIRIHMIQENRPTVWDDDYNKFKPKSL